MKSNNKILGVTLILLGITLVYYVTSRERKPNAKPIENKVSISDSATTAPPEMIPAEMGAKPATNPKDGSVTAVEEFVKKHVKNPSTFKFYEWSQVSADRGYWKVKCKYTGVSSFNKEVTTSAWFYIKSDKVVYTKIISKI
jgi:hypothetical protein